MEMTGSGIHDESVVKRVHAMGLASNWWGSSWLAYLRRYCTYVA